MMTSRMSRIRGKRDTLTGMMYLVLAIVIIVLMIIWGIPWMARTAGLLISTDNAPAMTDELTPTPPIFSDLPEATNSALISLSGFAQPGTDVQLFVNGSEYGKDLTDEAGVFKFEKVKINPGANTVYGYSISRAGTTSEQSRQYSILFDNEKPQVELTYPSDGEVFRGQSQRIVNFEGMVNEEGVKVVIGERMVILRSDGTFSQPYQLIDGDQEVKVVVTDRAGNALEKVLKLRWEP